MKNLAMLASKGIKKELRGYPVHVKDPNCPPEIKCPEFSKLETMAYNLSEARTPEQQDNLMKAIALMQAGF